LYTLPRLHPTALAISVAPVRARSGGPRGFSQKWHVDLGAVEATLDNPSASESSGSP
jgi:hypothetical protein